jgi:outer membrane usher protein
MKKNVPVFLLMFLSAGLTSAYPETAPAYTVKYFAGPLISVDAARGIIVVEEKANDYVVKLDSASMVLGRTGVIPLANLVVNDSVSVEYRHYVDNKRIANLVVQKTASGNAPAAQFDVAVQTAPKPQEPEKIDTTGQFKGTPAIEASKAEMEKMLSGKSREDLYQDIFHTSPPKRPKQVEATLLVNDQVDGTVEINFTEDRQDFSMPVAPIMKLLSKVVIPEVLKNISAGIDSTGQITRSALTHMGLQTEFDNDRHQVKVHVPSIFLREQVHQLSGQVEDPYAVETIKPNVVSAYCNLQADQQLRYLQNLSANQSSSQALLIESSNKNIRRPLTAVLDGAINVKNVVLEGTANCQEDLKHPLQRQDMRLLYDLPKQALRFSIGDLQYLTLGYESNVRMGGVAISKDYSLQPYVLTYPVGDHQFYLTNPAEAEVWVDEVLVSRMVLEPGTHDIRGFPFSTGNNHVKIYLKDFAGRRDTVDFSFLYNSTLLAKGFSRFSFVAGFPGNTAEERYTYNEDQPCLSLAYERGITNTLTLDLYSQAFTSQVNTSAFLNTVDTNTLLSKGYKLSGSREGMIGAGALYAIPQGFLELNTAGSYIKDRGFGLGLRLGYTYQTRISYKNADQKQPDALKLYSPLTWNTQVEYLSRKFLKTPVDSPYNYLEEFKLSTNVNVPLGDRLTITAGGEYYVRPDTTNLFELSFRIQKSWLRNLSASLTFQFTSDIYGNQANPAVIASVQWMFFSNKNEFALNETVSRHPPDVLQQSAASSQTSQTTQTSTATQPQWDFNTGFQWNYDNANQRPERILASAAAQLGPETNDYNAVLGYSGNQGVVELTQDLQQPEFSGANYLQHQTDLSLKTALVYADKTVCLSRPLYSGGFVIVKGVKNLKDTKILVNPSPQGYDAVSTFLGPAVLPLYAPYQLKRLTIEPENPPMGFVNEASSFTLFPQYKSGFSLEIGSEKSVLVLGTLHDADGSPFAYQIITVIAVNEKKAVPVSTFTNGVGRFQVLGHEKQTYKILPPASMERTPVTFTVPKNTSGYYRAGILTFAQADSTSGAVKPQAAEPDTSQPGTTKPGGEQNVPAKK